MGKQTTTKTIPAHTQTRLFFIHQNKIAVFPHCTAFVAHDVVLNYLLRCGEVGAVGARGTVFGSGAAGDVIRIRQRPALHLCQHTLLVQQRLEEPCVAVELHEVEDLNGRIERKSKEKEEWMI